MKKYRYEIQSGMDGTVNEIAALSSGLLLAGLGLLSFIRLIHFSFVLFFIIFLWIMVSFMLYSEYRKSIRRALETAGPDLNLKTDAHLLKNRFSARLAFRNDNFRLISEEIKMKETAWKMLSGSKVPQTSEILRLLRDNSIESKRFAISMIGKFRLAEMLPEICQCLNVASLETDAASVLISFGDEATDDLIRFFMASSGNINAGRTILRLLGKIKNKERLCIPVFQALVKLKADEGSSC